MFSVVKGGKLPTRGTKYSACVDLYAREDIVIGTGDTKIVPLGVKIDLEELHTSLIDNDILLKFEYFMRTHKLDLHIRSSLSFKKGLIIANGTGQIDLDYPDEIGIILHKPIELESFANYLRDERGQDELPVFDKTVHIKAGDRIAQITIVEHKSYLFGIESEEERVGGYGSTDQEDTHISSMLNDEAIERLTK